SYQSLATSDPHSFPTRRSSDLDRQMRDKILGFNAHLRVQEEAPMRDWEPLMRIVAADPEVKAVTPYVIGRVMVQTEPDQGNPLRSEEHTSELQSRVDLVCRLLL